MSTECPIEEALEAVRFAELERDDLDLSDEFDAAIYSMWYLLDPLGTGTRESVGTTDACKMILPREKTKNLKFTAHSHTGEPLVPSPDDIKLYSIHSRRGNFVHFIIDRFLCRKVK